MHCYYYMAIMLWMTTDKQLLPLGVRLRTMVFKVSPRRLDTQKSWHGRPCSLNENEKKNRKRPGGGWKGNQCYQPTSPSSCQSLIALACRTRACQLRHDRSRPGQKLS
ncbi:Alba DNA/RNA-binding protein [Zea mays]|uniref:Alba DNA/RNA-binding protein n=1 Tax=Zea mays TaxID=4577 RepID=A0A1D6MK42_MAIZE|nr:Alba DNA/RNA-binding protein [Zea mays]